ncbi:MAG TPA: Rieske (2Fe-2S) protein [Candidatus Limnocylindrales bacterium]|nr:Rieske (2Fe-2S) protein [Candidatus Limnocylindrales bacterium]
MWKKISDTTALQEGKPIKVQHEGKHIMIVRLDQNYFATTGRCPHLGCFLAEGTLAKTIITCPCHGSSFDVTDGHLVRWISKWPKAISVITQKIGLARSLKVYRVEKRGEDIFIDL